MKNGDFFQYPIKGPFILPKEYDELDEENRNERFWVKMMKAGLPFDFSKVKNLTSKPICWTNKPGILCKSIVMDGNTIEETQKGLLYHSLLNSAPIMPEFLHEYELELTKTAFYLQDEQKVKVIQDEMKNGFSLIAFEIKAYHIRDKVDE